MTTFIVDIVVGSLAGFVFGLVYFGGLWVTLGQAQRSPRPYAILGLSFVLRTGLIIAGFYLLLVQNIVALIAGVAGFTIVRVIMTARQVRLAQNAKDSG